METVGIRWTLPVSESEEADEAHMMAVHGVQHALVGTAPFFAGCDRGDLDTAWAMLALDTFQPAVYVFDGFPGGIGLCDELWNRIDAHWVASADFLASCPCDFGCPRCLYMSNCEVANASLSKSGALAMLQA